MPTNTTSTVTTPQPMFVPGAVPVFLFSSFHPDTTIAKFSSVFAPSTLTTGLSLVHPPPAPRVKFTLSSTAPTVSPQGTCITLPSHRNPLSLPYTPPRWTPFISSTTPVPPVHTGLLPATTSTHEVLPSIASIPLPLPTRPVYCAAVSSTSSGSSTSHPLFQPPEPVTSVVPSNLSSFDFQAPPTTLITNPQVKWPKLTLRKFSGDLTTWSGCILVYL